MNYKAISTYSLAKCSASKLFLAFNDRRIARLICVSSLYISCLVSTKDKDEERKLCTHSHWLTFAVVPKGWWTLLLGYLRTRIHNNLPSSPQSVHHGRKISNPLWEDKYVWVSGLLETWVNERSTIKINVLCEAKLIEQSIH